MINKYSILNGAKYFSSNGLQNDLVFISNRCIEFISNDSDNTELCSSTGMSQKSIKNQHTSDINFSPKMIDNYILNGRVRFKGICLKQVSVSFLHRKVVNLYISHELDTWSKDLNTVFTLGNCLIGAMKLTKNADQDK